MTEKVISNHTFNYLHFPSKQKRKITFVFIAGSEFFKPEMQSRKSDGIGTKLRDI